MYETGASCSVQDSKQVQVRKLLHIMNTYFVWSNISESYRTISLYNTVHVKYKSFFSTPKSYLHTQNNSTEPSIKALHDARSFPSWFRQGHIYLHPYFIAHLPSRVNYSIVTTNFPFLKPNVGDAAKKIKNHMSSLSNEIIRSPKSIFAQTSTSALCQKRTNSFMSLPIRLLAIFVTIRHALALRTQLHLFSSSTACATSSRRRTVQQFLYHPFIYPILPWSLHHVIRWRLLPCRREFLRQLGHHFMKLRLDFIIASLVEAHRRREHNNSRRRRSEIRQWSRNHVRRFAFAFRTRLAIDFHKIGVALLAYFNHAGGKLLPIFCGAWFVGIRGDEPGR